MSPSQKAAIRIAAPVPGGVPDYFGLYPNYALSPLPPVVNITGGGTGATAVATVNGSLGGVITNITVINHGSGYWGAPVVVITGGFGTGAIANATINGTGSITGINVTNGGSGYSIAPTVAILGNGTNATATATINASGSVTNITVTNPGTHYNQIPVNVTIVTNYDALGVSYDGSSATASANIDPVNGTIANITVTNGGSGYGGIRKFVDSLPLPAQPGNPVVPNDLGEYIPVAVPDNTSYAGSDYYEIALVRYTEKMHADLNATTLQGYVQIETPAIAAIPGASKHIALNYTNGTAIQNLSSGQVYAVDNPQYMGPVIVAQSNRSVRIKFTNYLPTGTNGNLFLPVDPTIPGAGPGPKYINGSDCDWGYNRWSIIGNTTCVYYTQNRATLHLLGGSLPWISEGNVHQWITPAGENTLYTQGVNVQNVPDMPNPGAGSETFYYINNQSARLMLIQDHAYGITRLDVYAGEMTPYILQDRVEQTLINGGNITTAYGTNVTVAPGTIPDANHTIPLVIQDRAFVPGPNQLNAQDPTWNYSNTSGSLWFPHVYMTNQNPSPAIGYNDSNPMGRWDYSPWYIPLFVPGPYNMPVNNTLCNPTCPVGENAQNPGTPNPSFVTDAFVDTSVVNGVAYPYLNVEPRAYRFRIMNGANDRIYNLMWFVAASNKPMWVNGNLSDPSAGEVKMVPAFFNASIFNTSDPTMAEWLQTTPDGAKYTVLDGRASGVPDPAARGPMWIQIGNEGGLMPQVATLYNTPVGWDYFTKNITYLNIMAKTLLMAPSERADVIVDFSQYAGKTILLYNDLPNPPTTFDLRTDYYTCSKEDTAGAAARAVFTSDPCDLSRIGGAPSVLPGYGPNSRTILQIRVNNTTSAPAYNLTNLTTAIPAAYGASQPAPIVPESVYNAAFNTSVNDSWLVPAGPSVTFFNGGPLWGITVTNPGSGYTSNATVTITGGGGAGANATASVVHGVASVSLTNKGSGYVAAPTVTIDAPTAVGGVQAVAKPYFYLGAVAGVQMTSGGAYTTAPTVTFTGGSGTGATGTAILNGSIANIVIRNGGSNYFSIPTVTIAPPTTVGGVRATATVTRLVQRRVCATCITVTNPGSGYTTTPAVTISRPRFAGSARATATATRSVIGVNMTNGGSGYTNTTTGVPTVNFTGGTGTGAAGTVIYGGIITGIVVTDPGTGYVIVPNVTISLPDIAGMTNATATAALGTGQVGNLVLTNGGNGYTKAPTVTITGGGGTNATAVASGVTYVESDKGVVEQFDWSYGRQNGLIASDIPYQGAAAGTAIPYGYPDLPIQEILNNTPATCIVGCIGSASDGTQLWRLDNMGALMHPWVFPFPVQIVSKNTLDGWVLPPDPSEQGWKNIVRTSTADQIFVIIRPTNTTLPFAVPVSNRLLQPALPLNASFVDAQNALQTNTNQSYNWEYTWEESKLGYDEDEFMRPIVYNP